jgi:hypothetical protein
MHTDGPDLDWSHASDEPRSTHVRLI